MQRSNRGYSRRNLFDFQNNFPNKKQIKTAQPCACTMPQNGQIQPFQKNKTFLTYHRLMLLIYSPWKHQNWIELNWITLFKVSYVILKLHNSSHLLKVCLNNANRPKTIMTITIKMKQIRILKRTLYMTGQIFLYMTGCQIFLHNDIVI